MRSEILVVLDMVLLASALKTESPQCHVETNGCSIPKGVPRPFVETFTPACNRHDVCYRCVSVISNLFPRTLFPGGEKGKGPGIGRPIRHFDWLIDLGNSKPGKRALGTRLCDILLWYIDCLQSAFSLKIRLVLISSSTIANHDVIITTRD